MIGSILGDVIKRRKTIKMAQVIEEGDEDAD